MLKTLLAGALALAMIAPASADDNNKTANKNSVPAAKIQPPAGNQKPQPKKEITLKIGDPAPKIKVTKWLKGESVAGFQKGNIYVVEFWATWCGPCIASMPHLSELQAEYRSKGLTVVSLTSRDPNNSEQQVSEFVKNRGDIMEYTVAWCEDRATNEAYMVASGQQGIPCSFVVDQQGKVAYIGHPLILDLVLPKVLDGSWKGKEDAEIADKTLSSFFETLQKGNRDPVVGLKEFLTAEKENPTLSKLFADQKMMLLLRNKKYDEAEPLFQEIMTKATKSKDAMKLSSISRIWGSPQLNPEKRNIEWAVKAAETAHKLAGPKDLGSLLAVAQAYDAAGDKAKAAQWGDKAVDAAPNEQVKEQIKRMIQKYKN